MLKTIDRHEENIQTGRSNTDLLEHGNSFVPLMDSDKISYNRIFASPKQLVLQKEETGKEKLRRIHKKMIQELKEEPGNQENPIDEITSILGRIKISSRKLEKVIFESHT